MDRRFIISTGTSVSVPALLRCSSNFTLLHSRRTMSNYNSVKQPNETQKKQIKMLMTKNAEGIKV